MAETIAIRVPRSRAMVVSLLVAHLKDGHAFPSAAMRWLADALTIAGSHETDLRHAELVQAAAYAMHRMADRQRERDIARYDSDVVPHASADNVITGESDDHG